MQSIRHARALGLLTLALAAAWVVAAAYSAHAALRFNPLHLPAENPEATLLVAPQGWAFFTRNAQTEWTHAWVHGESGWHPTGTADDRTRYAYGADRTFRARSAELERLLVRVPAAAWSPCRRDPSACLDEHDAPVRLVSDEHHPTLCGDVGIVRREPVPFAWARAKEPVTMPSKIARVRIECSHL
jgi:antimicrobial peptide system SdpA family protein